MENECKDVGSNESGGGHLLAKKSAESGRGVLRRRGSVEDAVRMSEESSISLSVTFEFVDSKVGNAFLGGGAIHPVLQVFPRAELVHLELADTRVFDFAAFSEHLNLRDQSFVPPVRLGNESSLFTKGFSVVIDRFL